LTKPGPFAQRTIVLGSYVGIRSGDQLVAMAGERMRFDGFTEISAVCTHPDHRGRGHAVLLVSALMRSILARGETPFLHIFSDNTSAAALYRKLGFTYRRSLTVTVLKRLDERDGSGLHARIHLLNRASTASAARSPSCQAPPTVPQ
jgi:ribosomal protein S18 acetylase RimI-like enzyme